MMKAKEVKNKYSLFIRFKIFNDKIKHTKIKTSRRKAVTHNKLRRGCG